ncbi:hypothetical protein [Pseudomonas sp. CGJS7]|uniref:hypothetical protein n=1 Tax=Pseudomonas sp. CGJS7 TaxID=3109348 RepID=UPI00300A84DE
MKLLVLILAGGGWLQAHACECIPPLSETGMREANRIYTFVLLESESDRPRGTNMVAREVVSKVRVLSRVRGEAPPATVRYYRGGCCGTRMRAGGYYAAFLREPGDTVGMENLLYLGENERAYARTLASVHALLGQATPLPRGVLEASYERLYGGPPPPPEPKARKHSTK